MAETADSGTVAIPARRQRSFWRGFARPARAALPQYRGGSGTPMVCLHGFSDTWRTWEPVLSRLESDHDVLALTLPGHLHGPPVPPGAELTAAAIVDEVEAELDRAGIERAHMVGNSLGGWLALELAARGRALSAVALSPAGGWERGSRTERRIQRFFRRSHRRALRAAPYADVVARLPWARTIGLSHVVSRPFRVSREQYAHWIRGMAACDILEPVMDKVKAEGFVEELGPIDCPVRIAWGSKDRILDPVDASSRFRRMVPNAEFMVLPGLGHVPMSDDPELVARTVLELTRQVDGATAPAPAGALIEA